MPPTAYSYLRFSSPQQATGDSIRRQAQARESWLAAHPEIKLDTSLVLTDSGRSAFKRNNWDTYALARFVDCIKSGRVVAGSYLLVENLDRLSREDAGEATEKFLSIVNKGIVVVQLSPIVMEFRRPVNIQSLMFAIVELSRGHSESAIKSERGKAFWSRKQREAATRIVTRRVPGWIKYDNGKLVLDKAHAATLRRAFALARDGYGVAAIAKKFNDEGVPRMGRPTFKGRPVVWSAANLYHMLTSRTTLGEYQPYKDKDREAISEPVPNYFPRVVDEDTFHAVQAAITSRSLGRMRGRRGKHVNLFAGLLIDARDGGSLYYWHRSKLPTTLIPVNVKEGRTSQWSSFPAESFDQAILSKLVEVKASEIDGDGSTDRKVEAFAGQLAEIDQLLKAWTAKMDDVGIVDIVGAKLTELNGRRREVSERLAAAQREAAAPVSDAWEEFRGLTDLLRNDKSEELRLKVRSALRRSISSIHCLFVPRGRQQLAAVRVQFAGSESHRDYLIWHKMAFTGGKIARPAEWKARSFRADDTGPLDLRSQRDVKKMLGVLQEMDLSPMAEGRRRTQSKKAAKTT